MLFTAKRKKIANASLSFRHEFGLKGQNITGKQKHPIIKIGGRYHGEAHKERRRNEAKGKK
jgi:hypothetical protein